jgi:hypothetical protein
MRRRPTGSAEIGDARDSLASSPRAELLQDVFNVLSHRMRGYHEHRRDFSRRSSASNPPQNLQFASRQNGASIVLPAFVGAPGHPDQRWSQELEHRAIALIEVALAALQIQRPRTSCWGREPNTKTVIDAKWLPHAVVEAELSHSATRQAVGELQDARLVPVRTVLQRILRTEGSRGLSYLDRNTLGRDLGGLHDAPRTFRLDLVVTNNGVRRNQASEPLQKLSRKRIDACVCAGVPNEVERRPSVSVGQRDHSSTIRQRRVPTNSTASIGRTSDRRFSLYYAARGVSSAGRAPELHLGGRCGSG